MSKTESKKDNPSIGKNNAWYNYKFSAIYHTALQQARDIP